MSLSAVIVLLASLAHHPSSSAPAVTVKVAVDVPSGTGKPSFVDLTDGATISGERNFKVLVGTDDIVTKVEMYVGSERRAEETSTPYRFSIDTINEKDGPLDLKWVAYTDQSHTGSITIHLNVDNGLGQGADSHVQKGLKLLQDGKADDAITQGRIALKVDKSFTPARFLLARSYLQLGVFDKAQKYVQDVVDADPKNLAALDLSSTISLKQAFIQISQGDQQMETLNVIGTAFNTAVDNRRKYLDSQFDGAPTPKDDPSTMAYVDLAINALRFSAAINVLEPLFKKSPQRADYADRLAYCQMRDGRLKDAFDTLHELKTLGKNNSDAYAQALTGLIASYLGDDDAAKTALEDAELNDITNVGVQTAQASIALRQNNTTALQGIATALQKDQGQRTEVNYLLAALYNKIGSYSQERKYFELCVLAEPLNFDMYIEEGNSALALLKKTTKQEDINFQYAYAQKMYGAALAAKNDSYQAFTGLAIVFGLQGKASEAFNNAKNAAQAQPNSACAQEAYSACAHLLARSIRPKGLPANDEQKLAFATATRQADEYERLSVDAMAKAAKIDPKNAGGRGVPDMNDAYAFFTRFGRSPVIARPG